jgi:hypothetical protein
LRITVRVPVAFFFVQTKLLFRKDYALLLYKKRKTALEGTME